MGRVANGSRRKSAGFTPYVGSNPTPTIGRAGATVGVCSLVEHQPSKLRVAVRSSPVARFLTEPRSRCEDEVARVAQLVEHILVG